MIKTINQLREEWRHYQNPDAKIKRLVNNGDLTPIVRGLYETDPKSQGHYLAGNTYPLRWHTTISFPRPSTTLLVPHLKKGKQSAMAHRLALFCIVMYQAMLIPFIYY